MGKSVLVNNLPPLGNSFSQFATTPVVVKEGAGTLHRIVVGTVAGQAATVILYDNIAGSGTKIASMKFPTNDTKSVEFGVAFTTGLTVVTTNSPEVTVVYD
jgi:hypothetical protein